MARSTRLVILTKIIYTLWGRKRFILPVTYFPTNLLYPFTLRVTGITREKVIVDAFDYQIPVTQLCVLGALRVSEGDRDMAFS